MMHHFMIALAFGTIAAPAAAQDGLPADPAVEAVASRQVEIHNHTDLTIRRLSFRRLPAADSAEPAEDDEEAAWEAVLDEAGGEQVLETHTHLTVSWAAAECTAEFKAEMDDGTTEYGTVDACADKQLQFGAHFDHD